MKINNNFSRAPSRKKLTGMYLKKKMEGARANKTKKGNCTKVHSERTLNWLFI